jgi:hypothetical protein
MGTVHNFVPRRYTVVEAVRRTFMQMLRVMFFSDMTGAKFGCVLMSYLWGFTLIIPKNSVLFSQPEYLVMANTMPQGAWAFVFLLFGTLQLSLLLLSKPLDGFPAVFSAMQTALWLFVASALWFSPGSLPAGEVVIALMAGWIWVRAGFSTTPGRRWSDEHNP